jgi:hypothetical protein
MYLTKAQFEVFKHHRNSFSFRSYINLMLQTFSHLLIFLHCFDYSPNKKRIQTNVVSLNFMLYVNYFYDNQSLTKYDLFWTLMLSQLSV